MNNKIFEINKTKHFLLSQWDRSIEDKHLYKILPYANVSKDEKNVLMVMPSFLKKKEIEMDDTCCLILIVKENVLITGFWCNQPNYLFKKEKNANFIIIY